MARRSARPSLGGWWPSLRLSVAALGVAVVVLMAVVVADVVAGHLRQTAANAAVHSVEAIVRGYVDPQITEQDLAIDAAPAGDLSAELGRISVSGDIRQISIWSRDGRIVYSTEAGLRGRRFSVGEGLARAFAGSSVS